MMINNRVKIWSLYSFKALVLGSSPSRPTNKNKQLHNHFWKFVRKESLPNCRGVSDPVAFFETESLS
jgi:hypothetical protein